VALISQAQSALTGGIGAADLSLNSNAIWAVGKTYETGTATLKVKGTSKARLDISAGSVIRSEIRNDTADTDGAWIGADGTTHKLALHNCQTLPAWFSPATFMTAMTGANVVLQYVGQETRNSIAVDHIRYFQRTAGLYKSQRAAALFAQLSQTEIYLDAASHLPRVIVYNSHPEQDQDTNFPVEVRFAAYKVTNGINAPSHIQRLLNGSLNLDLTITSIQVNSGVPDSIFALQ